MVNKFTNIFITLLVFSASFKCLGQQLHNGFSYIKNEIPTIEIELRYASNHNFIGSVVNGYEAPVGILSTKAVNALKKIQQKLAKKNLGLKIFDAYRPQKAVDHFVSWAKKFNDTIKKQEFYPNVKKSELFDKGYIAHKSGHTRGSTIDVTLIDLDTKKELDMGSSYDFFGEESWVVYKNITKTQRKNRMLLQRVMRKYFNKYDQEWWHFTLKNEPFPTTYFDFNVK